MSQRKLSVYTKEFKQDAIEYVATHSDLTITQCAHNLDVNKRTLYGWVNGQRDSKQEFRGSGNHASDEAKEVARLKKELQDTKDALTILKKTIKILGEE